LYNLKELIMKKQVPPVAAATKAPSTLKKTAAQIGASLAKTTTAPPKKKEVVFKPPKDLAVCADLLYTTQRERAELTRLVEALASKEHVLREHIINTLPKSSSGVSGKLARISIELKTTIKMVDWDAYYTNVVKEFKKEGVAAFAFLQKRVGESIVKERWAAGKKVPGVEPLKIPVVSVNKV